MLPLVLFLKILNLQWPHLPHELFGYEEVEDIRETKRKYLYSVCAKARERVFSFEGFTRGFVSGLSSNSNSGCNRPLLVQDYETTSGLLDLIAGVQACLMPRTLMFFVRPL